MPDDFIRAADGAPIFTDGSARERLAAVLRSPDLTLGPSREEEKRADEAAGREKADADPAWSQVSRIALGAIAAANELSDRSEQQKADLKRAAYAAWATDASEGFPTRLLTDTDRMRAVLADVRSRWQAGAIPMPTTNADMVAMQIRLGRLDHATPEQALPIIEEAVQRDDRALLAAAATDIAAWRAVRNSWRAREAREAVERMVAMIDRATWTPARAVAEYVDERARRTADAWRYLSAQLTSGQPSARLDPVHRATGALAPLLEPDGSQ